MIPYIHCTPIIVKTNECQVRLINPTVQQLYLMVEVNIRGRLYERWIALSTG